MVNISILDEAECTGCYGCLNACPNSSIAFHMDSKGFFRPCINAETCIDCGDCIKACPVLSPVSTEADAPTCYAAWSEDSEVRINSSSGGVFSELAAYIFREGGAVYGASFDESFNLHHIKVTQDFELSKIRGSKYIQSQINGVYREIINHANSRVPTLFCGTPCQVEALQRIAQLNNACSYVYTCDVICHGVSSQLVFNSYLEHLARSHNSAIKSYNFRDKRKGWLKYGTSVEFVNGENSFKIHRDDPFMLGYLRNYYIRPSCLSCKFAKIPRSSDITLGDYWGAPRELIDPRGVSVILSNNDQGDHLIEGITKIQKVQANLSDIERGNPRLTNGVLKIPDDISRFNEKITEGGFKSVIQDHLSPTPTHIALMTKIRNKIVDEMRKLGARATWTR